MGEGGQFPEGASPRVRDPRRHENPLKVASGPWAAPSSLPPLRSGPREPCPSVSAQNRLTGVCRLTTALCQGGDRGHGFRGHPPVLPGALRGETAAASSRPRSPRLSPAASRSAPSRVGLWGPHLRARPRPNDPPTQSSVCCRPLHDTHCWVCKSDFLTVSFYLPIWQAFIYFYYEAKSLKL